MSCFSALPEGWAIKLLVQVIHCKGTLRGLKVVFLLFLLAIFFLEVLQVSSTGHRVVKLLFAQTALALAGRESTMTEMSLCLVLNIYRDTLPVVPFKSLPLSILSFLRGISPGVLPYLLFGELSPFKTTTSFT